LDKEYYNDATVSLNLLSFGGSIEVMGEVNSPGTYDLPPDRRLTITAAIARAGGLLNLQIKEKLN
jgi:protein involved in polysaccharide export with SLBB domain